MVHFRQLRSWIPREPPQISNFKHGKERGGWEEGKGLDFSAPPSAHRDLVARPNWTFVSSCLVSLLLILFISHRQELCCNQAVVSSLGQPAGAPARPLTRENLWPVLQGSLLSVSSNLKSCSSSWNRPLKAVPTSSPRLLPVRSADC